MINIMKPKLYFNLAKYKLAAGSWRLFQSCRANCQLPTANRHIRVFLLVISAVMLTIGCGNKESEVHPQMRILTEAVYASGTMVPAVEYKVVPNTEGFLQQALVKEGDTIQKGQLLFTLT